MKGSDRGILFGLGNLTAQNERLGPDLYFTIHPARDCAKMTPKHRDFGKEMGIVGGSITPTGAGTRSLGKVSPSW